MAFVPSYIFNASKAKKDPLQVILELELACSSGEQ